MANKPGENLLYDFLTSHLSAFGDDFELHPTPYDKRTKNNGLEIGDADSSMLPSSSEQGVNEFDILLSIEIYGRVQGKNKTDRLPARQKVYELKRVLLQLFLDFPSLNGQCFEVQALRQMRFFDDTAADKYAIERVPVVINRKSLNIN
jgi:hypothetical protein